MIGMLPRVIVRLGGIGLAAALLMLPGPASAATVCSPTRTVYATSDTSDLQYATSSYVTSTLGTIVFTQGTPGCVIVRVSAEIAATNGNVMLFRALIDNSVFAVQPEAVFTGEDSGSSYRSHSWDFVFPNVAAGKHKLKIQLKGSTADAVRIRQHYAIINFRP